MKLLIPILELEFFGKNNYAFSGAFSATSFPL